MRKFAAILATAGAAFAVGNANAVFLSVDNFNSPNIYMHDDQLGAGINMFAGPNIASQVGIGASYSDATRTIVHNWIKPDDGSIDNLLGGGSNVRIGTQAFPNGSLAMNNVSGFNSVVDVTWTLADGFVPSTGPVSFFFAVVNSDAVVKNLSYSINGGAVTNIGTYNTSIVVPGIDPFAVALTASDQAALSAAGPKSFTLRVSGGEGWDFAIDSFGFQIPEPATLALVGLALVGAGVASRRRKA
jgi:hypothetical protein